MSEAIVPDSEHRGLVARLPERMRDFAQLARFDRPIGWWLLFWPCAWGVWLAGGGLQWQLVLWLLLGAIAMRGAGCVYNDIVDADLDRQVARTASRPVASGRVSAKAAWLWLLVLCGVGLVVLLQLRLPGQLEQHDQADEAQRKQPEPGGLCADPAAGDGACGGARHLAVEIGIDDVVVDAAGAAHGDRAEQQPQHQFPLRPGPGEPHAPGAGPEQQPPADRPVEPREQREIAKRLREARDETAMLAVRRDDFGAHGLPPTTRRG